MGPSLRCIKVLSSGSTRGGNVPYTPRAGRYASLAASLLGAALIGAGLILLFERIRTDGIAGLWALVLVALGVVGAGLGSSADRDEAWWLIDTGRSLLIETLPHLTVRLVPPLGVLLAGLVTLGITRSHTPSVPARGESHAES
jgi:hypothetical protein